MRKCSKCNNSVVNAAKTCEICILKRVSYEQFGTNKRWRDLHGIFEKQKYRCVYGGIKLRLGTDASLDHIIAKKNGGTNDLGNLQWIHIWLNKMKYDLGEQKFLKDLDKWLPSIAHFRHIPTNSA